MSSGLLATVPSGSNGNGNGNGNAEASSDSMRFSETSRDAAAPSSKWHRDPLLLLTLQTCGCFMTSCVASGSELFEEDLFVLLFISQPIRCQFTPRETGKVVS